MAIVKQKLCKDCMKDLPPDTIVKRPREAKFPGPRCATHHYLNRQKTRKANHERMVTQTYQGMGPGDYDRLYAYQGGCCAICGPKAKGISKRLSVDHNHRTGKVRGLLCTDCNQYIGRKGDNPQVGQAMADYLADEDRDVLASMKAGNIT